MQQQHCTLDSAASQLHCGVAWQLTCHVDAAIYWLTPIFAHMCRVPHIHEVDKAADSQSRGSPAARAATTSNAADSIAGTASIPRNSIAGSINMQPNVYPGSDLLQFVPEQQFKLLDRSGQLVGVERHLQHSYGLAFSALEAIAAVEKFALVVAPLVVAEQLRKELLDTQVGKHHVCQDGMLLDLESEVRHCPLICQRQL